jgi:hypothetical protein
VVNNFLKYSKALRNSQLIKTLLEIATVEKTSVQNVPDGDGIVKV